MTHAPRWSPPTIAVVAVALAFTAASLASLRLPGLDHDETLFVAAALGETGREAVRYQVGGVPLLVMSYIGALKAWLWAPLFAVFGVSVATVRVPVILAGAVCVLLAGGIGRRLAGGAGAVAAACLVACDASFVLWTRCDYGPIALAMLCKLLALRCWLAWIDGGGAAALWGIAVACAAGSFHKLDFVWFAGALAVATLAVDGRGSWRQLRDLGARALGPLGLLAVTALFAFLLLRWNLHYGFSEHSERPFGSHVREVLRGCLRSLSGTGAFDLLQATDAGRARLDDGAWFWIAISGALVALAAALLHWRHAPAGSIRRLLGLAVVGAGVLAAMAATPQAGGQHHYLMLHPLPQLAAVAAFAAAPGLVRRAWPLVLGAALVCGGPRSWAVTVGLRDWEAATDAPEFRPRFSPAIYELSRRVNELDVDAVVCADWGLHNPLSALAPADRRGRFVEIWAQLELAETDAARRRDLVAGRFQGKRAALVTHTASCVARPRAAQVFTEIAREALVAEGPTTTIRNSLGTPLYEVTLFRAR
jgi:4-amino-4-deoxy-L-arabinose transferase-like glycosyltransferase